MPKMFGCENLTSSFDWDKAVAAGRKNAKAFSDATKAAIDGLQLIANRQAELIQEQTEEAQKFFSSFASSNNPENALEQLTKATKANTDKAIARSNELLIVATKSASDTADIIGKRFSDAISECSSEAYSTSSERQKKNAA